MIWIEGTLVSRGNGGVYGERMIGGMRVWDPYRSKLAAYYYLGGTLDLFPLMRVLYLGAANGTTVSHVADYVEVVYAVENASRPMRDLLAVAARRKQVIPIMADANVPENYASLVEGVHLIYQDVAHPGQVEIASRNSPFLEPGGGILLMLKTRSIDVRRSPEVVAEEACRQLETCGFSIEHLLWLTPYHKDHAAIHCRKVHD
ncbi:MAG: fibrillarin-like rRNA/tRNA 2'-O-methyltransferase [Methanolinea sp.]|nr:fibrillarin-like rRNA/tRNA 2'-O-methyltransferase [Methanolinea sp.]